MEIKYYEKIASDIQYLREELRGKLHGDQDGDVSIEAMVKFLEGDNCYNISVMEHLISVVKLKNNIK